MFSSIIFSPSFVGKYHKEMLHLESKIASSFGSFWYWVFCVPRGYNAGQVVRGHAFWYTLGMTWLHVDFACTFVTAQSATHILLLKKQSLNE